ncbi:MAG: DNA alkylation repair protein [Flavobacteriaceae bacterium]|nr:DNA alkylation repair protein [Flavobacteriaceae bacterium]
MFTKDLKTAFKANSNPEFAAQMKAYLRDKFEFYGIKTKLRRDLLKASVANYKDDINNDIRAISKELFNSSFRELHHCGLELFEKQLRKKYNKDDIHQIEFFITTNSCWDTVDFIAKQILGAYLKQFPEETETVISRFSASKNMWLNRSAILFQLGYKEQTDEGLFYKLCLQHRHSDEFFIQKAIGWALREYGKTNPESVLRFVRSNTLKPLSEREAIRNLI